MELLDGVSFENEKCGGGSSRTSFEGGGTGEPGQELQAKEDCELKEKMATKRKKDEETGDDFDMESSGTDVAVTDNKGN